jgi:hypothetical protein
MRSVIGLREATLALFRQYGDMSLGRRPGRVRIGAFLSQCITLLYSITDTGACANQSGLDSMPTTNGYGSTISYSPL